MYVTRIRIEKHGPIPTVGVAARLEDPPVPEANDGIELDGEPGLRERRTAPRMEFLATVGVAP